MNILLIDTATTLEFVVAMAGDRCADASRPQAPSHSVTLMESIDTCLKRLGCAPQDLDCLGAGIGPGSFTGIRIGVATMRMMAQVLSRPVVGIPTPELFAVGMDVPAGDLVLVAFDAKKQRVFGGLYEIGDDPLAPRVMVAPGDYPLAELAARCTDGRTVHLAGSGIGVYGTQVSLPARSVMHDGFVPDAARCCRLVQRRYETEPDRYADYNALLPLYGRKSDAELVKEGRL